MLEVRIDSNINRIKARFEALAAGLEEKAIVRALNRAGDQSVTAASREIRAVYNLKAAAVRSQIRVRDRAARGKLYFTIRIFSKRIPLIEFGARQTKRGVTVAVKKGSRKLIPRAFIARMASGHVGVFARIHGRHRANVPFRFGPGSGQAGRRFGDPDLPIGELTTLSVPRMFLEKSVKSAVRRVAVESFNKNFEQQLKFLTGSRA